MKKILFFTLINFLCIFSFNLKAQEENADKLKISGELFIDQRLLLNETNDWAWNENRLNLKFDKKIAGSSKFYSEIWVRNFGLPTVAQSADLYNKGIVSPYDIEIREAYVQTNGFITEKLDLKIGRQRIVWGTADKLNPTDNLNPADMEDMLDFGRRRGSDAINLNYYFSSDFSIQAVYLPFFQPANLPVGVFSSVLTPDMALSQGMTLKSFSNKVIMPKFNLKESGKYAVKFKGTAKGIDFSLSYVNGLTDLPTNTSNTIIPVDATGGVSVSAETSFERMHILGADMATSFGAVGVWAEAALFLPTENVVRTTTIINPMLPQPIVMDSVLMDKEKPAFKFILGADYSLPNGGYLNLQYMHGFMHEKAPADLNDYFFVRYDQKFLNEKLKIAPISGAFIVNDWSNVKENYAFAYMPQVSYMATNEVELALSAVLFGGKGNNMFANMKDFNMLMFTMKYSF